jgi:hypothetical protein
MVYEAMPMEVQHEHFAAHNVDPADRKRHPLLFIVVRDGYSLSILGTCRTIREEASGIIKGRIEGSACRPLKLIVRQHSSAELDYTAPNRFRLQQTCKKDQHQLTIGSVTLIIRRALDDPYLTRADYDCTDLERGIARWPAQPKSQRERLQSLGCQDTTPLIKVAVIPIEENVDTLGLEHETYSNQYDFWLRTYVSPVPEYGFANRIVKEKFPSMRTTQDHGRDGQSFRANGRTPILLGEFLSVEEYEKEWEETRPVRKAERSQFLWYKNCQRQLSRSRITFGTVRYTASSRTRARV